ncbi:hypothetical protein JNUCC0626_46500 [Lentzea sp. JNUCC 0626]|uniref:hypothetical protein n=1 Tax=Lentzea sp. JNUCC 0626 TaxID=3367513 RepID=UPI0037487520
MVRTTPPRPFDIAALIPGLAPLARTAVRLHPRPGDPTAADSSVGGPLLWPSDEAWPTCLEHAGPVIEGASVPDVLERRRILAEAWARPRSPGQNLLTEQEKVVVDRVDDGEEIAVDGPLPMVPVAQLYARDVPGLVWPGSADLLQVLWCPLDHEDEGYVPSTAVRWRVAADVTDPLASPPSPAAVEEHYLPQPCVLHPEEVVEYPAPHCLPQDLVALVREWEDGNHGAYQHNLAVAPGTKAGGHGPWSFSDPFPMSCPDCGADVAPLLTLASGEWDGGRSWQPVEDAEGGHPPFPQPSEPTMLMIGRGYNLQLYTCTADAAHGHVTNMQ